MKKLSDISNVKYILNKYGFKFSKSLGQNFIIDPTVCPEMAEKCAQSSECGVLEIGPGIGVLTIELAERYKKVVSVEIDKRLIPILSETTAQFDNVKIINDDILNIDLSEIIKNEFVGCSKVHVCANLPYYITSDIIMYILENNPGFESITVMVQKEAAERICAVPGARESGAISIAVRYYGTPEILFDVDRTCFLPSPNVDSCVIKINMNDVILHNIKDKKMFFRVVKAAYSKRRKNLLNSLSMGLPISKNDISNLLENLNIPTSYRAEQLTFQEFIKISNGLSDINYI